MTAEETSKKIGRYRYIVLGLLFIVGALACNNATKASTLVSFWGAGLSLGTVEIGRINAAYMLGFLPMVLLGGPFADWFGSKKTLLICLGGLVISGLLIATAKDYTQMYIYNVIAGVFYGLLTPAAAKLISQWFPAKEVGGATSIFFSGLIASGVLLNPIVLMLSSRVSWQAGYNVIALAGIPVIIAMLFIFKDIPEQSKAVKPEELEYITGARLPAGGKANWKELQKVITKPSVLIILIAVAVGAASTFLVSWVWYGTMGILGINVDTVAAVTPILLGLGAAYGFFHGKVITGVFKGNLRLVMSFGGILGVVALALAALVPMNWIVWAFLILAIGLTLNSFLIGTSNAYFSVLLGPKYIGSVMGLLTLVQQFFGWFISQESGKWVNGSAEGLAQLTPIYLVSAGLCLVAAILPWLAKGVNVLKPTTPSASE